MHIAIVTAGGAGMFCGSCMHDNTLANALMSAGAEVSLIPTYTPIRVDEADASERHIHLGGINVYLESQSRFWRMMPRFFKQICDARWAINLATKFGVSNNAKKLGELTLDMLAGEQGSQRRAMEELAEHIAMLKPDAVCFSNALLAGAVPSLKSRFDGKLFCILQGDDVFLDDLPSDYRERAVAAVHEKAEMFDGYLVHSDYYREFMSGYLSLPAEKFHKVPLGIDLSGHDGKAEERTPDRFTVGYFARICPEKGLHNLVAGFRLFHQKHPESQLKVGGSLIKKDAKYFKQVQRDANDLGDAFQHIGSPETHREKVDFFKSIDVLSVPTTYHEPKGLYVLEALANGTPVVQPNHGAFPELIESTGGGLLVEPNDPESLAEALEQLHTDAERRIGLAKTGQSNVREKYGPQPMAERTLAVLAGETDSMASDETVQADELAETVRG